jgi:hypothetical protein
MENVERKRIVIDLRRNFRHCILPNSLRWFQDAFPFFVPVIIFIVVFLHVRLRVHFPRKMPKLRLFFRFFIPPLPAIPEHHGASWAPMVGPAGRCRTGALLSSLQHVPLILWENNLFVALDNLSA